MISTKFVSSTAALALMAALSLPTASFAFHGGGGGHWGGGGGGMHFSGAGRSMGGGAPAAHSFAAAPAARSFAAAPAAGVAAPAAGAAWSGNRGNWSGSRTAWNGNNGAWRDGDRDGFHHRRFPGAFAAGAAVGALGAYAAYGGPDYYYDSGYDDAYYDNGGYYDDGATVAVVPGAGGGDASYCAQRYRSYDPASGTYLGYDGLRHPCP